MNNLLTGADDECDEFSASMCPIQQKANNMNKKVRRLSIANDILNSLNDPNVEKYLRETKERMMSVDLTPNMSTNTEVSIELNSVNEESINSNKPVSDVVPSKSN